MCSKPLCLLHNYLCRLDDALTTLKNAFLQQKNSSNALFLSQVCFLKVNCFTCASCICVCSGSLHYCYSADRDGTAACKL